MPPPNHGRYVVVKWDLPQKHVEVPWVGPVFDTFWEATQFAMAWNATARDYDQKRTHMDYSKPITDIFGLNWIVAGTHYVTGDPLKMADAGTDSTDKGEAKPSESAKKNGEVPAKAEFAWAQQTTASKETRTRKVSGVVDVLVEQTEKIVDHVISYEAPVRSWRARGWLWNLAVLLAPESGVPVDVSTPFCTNKTLKNFWLRPENSRQIRRIRAWLTRAAWGRTDLEKEFEVVTSLVNPARFATQCLELLRPIETRLRKKKGKKRQDSSKSAKDSDSADPLGVTSLISLFENLDGELIKLVEPRSKKLLQTTVPELPETIAAAELEATVKRKLAEALSNERDTFRNETDKFKTAIKDRLLYLSAKLISEAAARTATGTTDTITSADLGSTIESELKKWFDATPCPWAVADAADLVMSGIDKLVDELGKSARKASLTTPWREKLELAKGCIPLWIYSRAHPVNTIPGLCPEASDVPRSARREGLWSVEII